VPGPRDGLEMRKILKLTYAIPWTTESVKTYLWKPFQKALVGKEHTADLSKHQEIEKVHEALMHELGEKYGVEWIPFPDIHEIGGYCGKRSCPKCPKL
jgi:hypothetical protein